jgi:predicted DCC family thiol-disulfide oxidoreductase YuxK
MQNKYVRAIFSKFKDIFSIDLRALAFFRVFFGGIIFAYLIPKLMSVYAFYSDWGIAPRSSSVNLINNYFLSFHLISGQTWVQVLLILLQMFFAVLLIFGYRTRFVTLVSWVFLVSLQNRNPFVLNYGDQLFRVLLFWAMFLPLGAVWSLDSIWSRREVKTKKWFSVGTVAILLQMVLFYVVNWFLKDSIEWKGIFAQTHNLADIFDFSTGFSATYYAMNIGYLVTPFGYWLLRFPEILKPATIGYVFFELIGPLFLISPFRTKEFRYFSLIIFFTFIHGMLSIMLYTGLFQYFCYAGLILFLPSEFWDWLEQKLFTGRKSLKIYYDEECEFCTTGVCTLKAAIGASAILPIQTNKDLLGIKGDITTIIVEDETGKRYEKIDAFIKMFENSAFTAWLSWILKIKFFYWLATIKYEFIAKNRHKISRFISFIKPKYPSHNELLGVMTQGLAAIFLIMIVFWNYGNVVKQDYFADRYLQTIVYTLRLDQYWGMFAQRPTQESIWVVVSGELTDSTTVDVMNKTPGDVSFGRQDEPPARFWGQGWRNYFIDYPSKNNDHTKIFARYLCNDWNRHNPNSSKMLKNLTVYTFAQRTLLNGRDTPIERFRLEYIC